LSAAPPASPVPLATGGATGGAIGRATRPRVGLLVTCLVDLFRPQAGFAAIALLEAAGCEVVVPSAQTCCGQPAYNSGDRRDAITLAQRTIELFEPFDHVVIPSGSCAGMLRLHYPDLLAGDPVWAARAAALAERTVELTQFLVQRGMPSPIDAEHDGAVAFHDSCSALRETKSISEPRLLLRAVRGLELRDLADPEACCGFGGTFCVKYPAISDDMVTRKAADIVATGAETLAACDLGCLLNIAGKLARAGSSVRCFHVAEILAGRSGAPAIGEAPQASQDGGIR
jgi:L-lactate dehydrogenase complex protein LldE